MLLMKTKRWGRMSDPSYTQPDLSEVIPPHRAMRLRGLCQREDPIDDRPDPPGAKIVAETAHE